MLPEARGDVALVGEVPATTSTLSIDPDGLTVSGHENVSYTNRQTKNLTGLYFRLYPNLPARTTATLLVTRVQIAEQDLAAVYEAQRSALRVPLPAELRPGRTVRLDLDFRIALQTQGHRAACSSATARASSACRNAIPLLAVCENGVWNLSIGPDFADATFSDIALYHVRLTVPKGMVVATSGVVQAESDTVEGDQHAD